MIFGIDFINEKTLNLEKEINENNQCLKKDAEIQVDLLEAPELELLNQNDSSSDSVENESSNDVVAEGNLNDITDQLQIGEIVGNYQPEESDEESIQIKEFQGDKVQVRKTQVKKGNLSPMKETGRKIDLNQCQCSNIQSKHEKGKLHICPVCEFKTKWRPAMRRHIKVVHAEEKPYKCPHCGYKLSRKAHLRRHIQEVHENEKPHKCPECEYQASRKTHLKNHIEAKHTKRNSFNNC